MKIKNYDSYKKQKQAGFYTKPIPKLKFKIGDRVIGLHNTGGFEISDIDGTIKHVHNDGYFTVEFDKEIVKRDWYNCYAKEIDVHGYHLARLTNSMVRERNEKIDKMRKLHMDVDPYFEENWI